MRRNRDARDGGQPSRAGQTDASKHLHQNYTTHHALRQLAERAAQNARRCGQREMGQKFSRLAMFLKDYAVRGGVK